MASFINSLVSGPGGIAMQGDGSGILQIQANNTPYITITPGAATNIVNIPTGVGGTPAFSAYKTASQTGISSNTWTKVTFPYTEFNLNNNFDTTNSRFLPTVAGYYQMNMSVYITSNTSATDLYMQAYKNGAGFSPKATYINFNSISTPTCTLTQSYLTYMNGTTDYLEVWMYTNATTNNTAHMSGTGFSGFLARAV